VQFKKEKMYSLRFFSTNEKTDELHPAGNEIFSTLPEVVIKYVFDRITEGFVIIKEIPCTS
jgi:hypothetical protein